MRSLHARLLLVITLTVVIGWGAWLGFQYQQVSGREGGKSDLLLTNMAEQILLSLPSNIGTSGASNRLSLASGETVTQGKLQGLHFQVWVPRERRNILSSAGAPMTPLSPAFRPGFSDVVLDGQRIRVYAVNDSTGTIQVQTGQSVAMREAELLLWVKNSVLLAVAVLILLGLSIWGVVRWSLRPTRLLQQSVAARANSDLAPLSTHGLPHELVPLVDAFNGLLAKLGNSLDRERQFLGDAAHELRTPLAALLAQVQVAQHSSSRAEAEAALATVVSGIERTSRLAQQLLDSARVDSDRAAYQRMPVDLAGVAAMVAEEFEVPMERKSQTLELQGHAAYVDGNLDDLGILVRNLLDNAVRYTPSEGRVVLSTASNEKEGRVVLSILDDGPGVPLDEQGHLFERFYRGSTGNGERGSGIGLALIAHIARSHGASVHLVPGIEQRGFGVEVVFPPAGRAG
jgi:signal transduction histidine kinase